MGKYLELLEENRRKRAASTEAGRSAPARNAEARDPSAVSEADASGLEPTVAFELRRRGWKDKVRSGKTIWQNPATGFYCSQEVAIHIVETQP
jgi:hypothetical protein